MSALFRLEEAGIELVPSLEKMHAQLARVLGIKSKVQGSAEIVVKQWIAGKSPRPPTWSSLYNVLRELNVKELAQQIEEYFSGK